MTIAYVCHGIRDCLGMQDAKDQTTQKEQLV